MCVITAWQPQHQTENVYSGLLTLTGADNCSQILEKISTSTYSVLTWWILGGGGGGGGGSEQLLRATQRGAACLS